MKNLKAALDLANVVGADPHKRTVTTTVLDCRGGVLGTDAFDTTDEGLAAMEAWALGFGPVTRWGIEGASGPGRHTAAFLAARGHDVRDVCPNRTNERRRARQGPKSDAADSVRIAREALAEAGLPAAFKRADGDAGPDELGELLELWHNERRSLRRSSQHLLNEAEALLSALPEAARAGIPDVADVRRRLRALGERDRSMRWEPPTSLRLRLLDSHAATIAALDARERETTKELARLNRRAGSTLGELCGLADRSTTELLVEVGDPRRFRSEAAFARFNGTAPLEVSSGEGRNEPKRHRLNRGGNRRVNAVLHRMAVTQLRCDERARRLFDDARQRGHTKKEAMRVLKRHLSNVVYRRMVHDLDARLAARPQAA